jgi:hypothetical protein
VRHRTVVRFRGGDPGEREHSGDAAEEIVLHDHELMKDDGHDRQQRTRQWDGDAEDLKDCRTRQRVERQSDRTVKVHERRSEQRHLAEIGERQLVQPAEDVQFRMSVRIVRERAGPLNPVDPLQVVWVCGLQRQAEIEDDHDDSEGRKRPPRPQRHLT